VSPAIFFSLAIAAPAPVTETLFTLELQPMAAPRPALRYLLLPELKEMTPGNPVAGYLECLFLRDPEAEKETFSKAALRQADRAARLDKVDWQMLLKAKKDNIGLLVPDVGELRKLGDALRERFREEAAAGRFDQAVVSLKTMFALARHVGEHPTLIGHLVGVAIARLAVDCVQELLERPGCPNLYWALTNLPAPLLTLEKGMEGERLLIEGLLEKFIDTEAPQNPSELRKRIEGLVRGRDFEEKPSDEKVQAWLDARTKDPLWVVHARTRLVEYGIPEDRLRKFPIEQIILLDEKREFEARRDEAMKYISLPACQFEEMLARAKPEKEKALLDLLVPATKNVRRIQGRLEQRIALLRHIEAIRLYAADHTGALPAHLSDLEVPLPPDPFTGKPFRYEVKGETAHLCGSPPPGKEKDATFNVHYEVRVGSRQ
jgi:hypothetical protein